MIFFIQKTENNTILTVPKLPPRIYQLISKKLAEHYSSVETASSQVNKLCQQTSNEQQHEQMCVMNEGNSRETIKLMIFP